MTISWDRPPLPNIDVTMRETRDVKISIPRTNKATSAQGGLEEVRVLYRITYVYHSCFGGNSFVE